MTARALRYADSLPRTAAAAAFLIGIVNLASTLTPNAAWRGHLLLQALPVRAVPVFHSLAVPVSVALIALSRPLLRRRRRAVYAAVAMLTLLGLLNLLKGLDVEEAALSFATAGLLWWARDAFPVQHERLSLRGALGLLLAATATVAAAGAALVWIATGRSAEPLTVAATTIDFFAWTRDSGSLGDEMTVVPLILGLSTIAGIAAAAALFFRPVRAPRTPACDDEWASAQRIVHEHGSDTLAFFKLRRDMQYLFSTDERAFLGYRIESGTLLVAGDPVGPADALPGLVRDALVFAETHGLRVAVLGAHEELLPTWHDAGLHSLYIGDEAIVETASFSLEGRAIRKVRQSVSRLTAAGYSAEVIPVELVDAHTLAELEHISELWREGAPERGFAMSMDTLTEAEGSIVVVARDAAGAIRGFLHFVPSFGRDALSLSLMRRDRATPNGLTEYLVVSAIELLRARGVAELSLNFAAFARLIERPEGHLEHALSHVVSLGNRYFQLESLYRFNAKFSPRWEPRYLVFESVLGLPRAGLAAMWAEGQIPRLPLGGRL